MANIHGAMLVAGKRIKTKWSKLEQNRLDLDQLCAELESRGQQDAAEVAHKLERLTQLLDENKTLLQEIEKQYRALFVVRYR